RGTLGGMDAATELTWTYLQRVLRWWAGRGPAAKCRASTPQLIFRAVNVLHGDQHRRSGLAGSVKR
ncbi:hypothetical protein XspCFBP7912_21445, partial [Xanthomonas sp. CFBP 7912]